MNPRREPLLVGDRRSELCQSFTLARPALARRRAPGHARRLDSARSARARRRFQQV